MSAAASPTNPTVERLIKASGLAPIIARGVVARCCARLGLVPDNISPRDLPRIVALVEPLLALYLRGAELQHHVAELQRLAGDV